jgi:hypothetical protein
MEKKSLRNYSTWKNGLRKRKRISLAFSLAGNQRERKVWYMLIA